MKHQYELLGVQVVMLSDREHICFGMKVILGSNIMKIE